ncbi:hypothetical protein FACS189450_04830 [Spirochaetia bacterium]|nr:hypothetical protein FACS189450_04830 [Spirochaetia bacterium]
MGAVKTIVLTTFGQGETVERISVSLFDVESDNYGNKSSGARNYCRSINKLDLKNDAWVSARIVKEYAEYTLKELLPFKSTFPELVMDIDDKAIQRFLREVNTQDLALSLKSIDINIRDKIFRNMSKKAAQMVKEDMEMMGPRPAADVEEQREELADVIMRLESEGDIVFIKNMVLVD